MGKDMFGDEGMFCQHGGDPDRCIVCNPKTGDPDEWNEFCLDEKEIKMKTTGNDYIDYIIELREALAAVTFALESVAHLQGREKELLHLCDHARKVIEDKKGNHLCEY